MLQSIVHVCLAGLSTGMFIWLVASGLTLIFGVLGVLNFAHGSFYMLGAYFCYTALRLLGNNFWLGLIFGPLAVCVIGFVVERFFLRYVYHLALPYQLLLTFAFVLIFDNLVNIIWGAGSIGSPSVPGLSGSVPILGRGFPVYNLFIIAMGPLVALGLWAFLEKTWWGRNHPGGCFGPGDGLSHWNQSPVALHGGVHLWRLAGGGRGALAVPYVGLLTSGMGQAIIIEAFSVVAVIGGLGSLQRSSSWAPSSSACFPSFGTRYIPTFDMFLTFILMAMVLLWRPQGFFGEGEQ